MALMQTTNNASTTIAAGISSSATSVTLASGTGVLFPAITGSQYFHATFVKAGAPGTFEIVKVTARSVDTCTIVRAQESTPTALNWALGDFFELFLTAGDVATFTQFEDLQAQTGNYAVDTGAANAYVVALSPAITAHITGMPIRWKASNPSTGACTFNDGAGAGALVTPSDLALGPLDIVAGGVYESVWDGAKFQLITVQRTSFAQLTSNASAAQVPNANGVQATVTSSAINFSVAFLNAGNGPGNVLFNAQFSFNPGEGTLNLPNVSASGIINAGTPFGGGPAAGDFTANRGSGAGAIYLGAAGNYLFYNGTGTYFFGSGTISANAYNTTCDARLKEDVEIIPDALELVRSWNGVTFSWIGSYKAMAGKRSVGLIAQDVAKGLPEAIGTYQIDAASDPNGEEYMSVNAMGGVAALVESTKILANMVEKLTARVQELESQRT